MNRGGVIMNIKKIISTIAVIGCLSACMIPAVSYADEIQYVG